MTNPKSSFQKEASITYDLVRFHSNHYILVILAAIASNQWKLIVESIRQLARAGNKEAANQVKKHLPGVTFSCTYHPRRCHENVKGYTGIVVLDADNLSDADLVRTVALLPSCPFTYSFFLSPSGNGLKILVQTNGVQEHHRETYKAVMDYYSKFLKVSFDAHCSDICRLTFVSHDPNLYINREAHIFDVSALPEKKMPSGRKSIPLSLPSLGTDATHYLFQKSVRFTNRKSQFAEGNRNNFVFLLSCYCRMNGMNREDALHEILNRHNYSQREITSAVKSAYRYK